MKEIRKENLLELSKDAGETMLKGLKDLENRFPGLWHAARGIGTFGAVDCPTTAIR